MTPADSDPLSTILNALSVLSASAANAFLSRATSGIATADLRHGSTSAAAADWCTGHSRHGCSFHVPRSAASVPVGSDTLVRVRVRDDPIREEVLIASATPCFESESGAVAVEGEEKEEEGPPPWQGELLLDLPTASGGDSLESTVASAPAALLLLLSAGGLTKLDASSKGEAFRPASWMVRHMARAAMMC